MLLINIIILSLFLLLMFLLLDLFLHKFFDLRVQHLITIVILKHGSTTRHIINPWNKLTN